MIDHGVLTDIISGTVLQALNDAGYEIVRIGQPRQADPSGAASSSTTSEQPANPAAWPKYHGLCYCSATQTCRYCRDAL